MLTASVLDDSTGTDTTIVALRCYDRGMKRRLSASIDEQLLEAAEAAVRDGRAPSVSALVEDAIRRQLEHTRRLQAGEAFIEAFEDRYGAFEPGEAERLSADFWAGTKTAEEVLAEGASPAEGNATARAPRAA